MTEKSIVSMKAISEKLEALRTSVSSTISGAPATYTVPLGPVRNSIYNASCLTNSTPQATFDTLFRRLQALEKSSDPILLVLEDDIGKQNALTAASLRLLFRQGLEGYKAIDETSEAVGSLAAALQRRLDESKRSCLLKSNAAAVAGGDAADVPTYRPDDSTPFGGVSVDFDSVEQERQELVGLLGLR